MRQSGATLVEVGTTNRTYTGDYEAALTEQTAGLICGSTPATTALWASPLRAALRNWRRWPTRTTCGGGRRGQRGAARHRRAMAWSPSRWCRKSLAAGADLVCSAGTSCWAGRRRDHRGRGVACCATESTRSRALCAWTSDVGRAGSDAAAIICGRGGARRAGVAHDLS